jgi:sulfur-oxidizing protein SoxZ
MQNVTPRVRVPATASAGEVIAIRTMISHPMHTGFGTDSDGAAVPRHIINRFTCTFNGETVVDIAIAPGISANPYFEFEALVPDSGEFLFTWHDDDGTVYTESSRIEVA